MTCGRSTASNGLTKMPCWMTEGHRAGGYLSGMNTRMVIKITLRPKGSIDSSLAVTLSLFTDRIKSKSPALHHPGQMVRDAFRLMSDDIEVVVVGPPAANMRRGCSAG